METLNIEALRDRARLVYWDIVITRKLLAAALADRRFLDANRYSKYLTAQEFLARLLLEKLA